MSGMRLLYIQGKSIAHVSYTPYTIRRQMFMNLTGSVCAD